MKQNCNPKFNNLFDSLTLSKSKTACKIQAVLVLYSGLPVNKIFLQSGYPTCQVTHTSPDAFCSVKNNSLISV